jgi:hypothetical protein
MKMNALYILWAASACSGSTPGPRSVAREVTPTRVSVNLVKSTIPIPERDNRTLPLWLIRTGVVQAAQARGATFAIVDTGARVTVVDEAFAAASGIPSTESNVTAREFSGQRLATKVVRRVRLRFGAIDTDEVDAVVLPLPEIFRRLGIGIIWSPQTSVPSSAMFSLDFSKGTLQMTSATQMPEQALPLCRGGFGSGWAAVRASVAGYPALFELDSGANDVSVHAGSVAGRALAAKVSSRKAAAMGAGGVVETLDLGTLTVQIGTTDFQTDTSITPTSAGESPADACRVDGLMGLPVLSHCTLAFTRDRFALQCRAP